MYIVVASKNPTKVAGVRAAFLRVGVPLFRKEGLGEISVTGIKVDTGVGEQPVGDEETKQGSLNRAEAVRVLEPKADFWVGVEGGVVWHPAPLTGAGQAATELECMAWITIIGSDGRIGKARSNGFLLPPAMSELIASGVPQSQADDQIIGRQDSGTTNGTVGYLSHNLIDRTHYTADAVILALAPFLHPELYPIQARDLLGGGAHDSSKVEESLEMSAS